MRLLDGLLWPGGVGARFVPVAGRLDTCVANCQMAAGGFEIQSASDSRAGETDTYQMYEHVRHTNQHIRTPT